MQYARPSGRVVTAPAETASRVPGTTGNGVLPCPVAPCSGLPLCRPPITPLSQEAPRLEHLFACPRPPVVLASQEGAGGPESHRHPAQVVRVVPQRGTARDDR